MRKAAHETNTAVFISSHILSEVQTLCDTVAFINNGIIQSVESINGGIVKENTETIILSVKEIEKCREILKSLNCIQGISFKEDVFKLIIDKNSIPEIIFKLAENKIHIEEVYKKHVELEDRYLEIVEGGKVV
ncbi:hypothetical protein SDC9_195196 [bioreactor metagenome]|uniref:Uncharacterized protein n=1 Tax=bioreactor metagenome TaxID=1076179 RepID=A0A645IJU5_9ZZZZ